MSAIIQRARPVIRAMQPYQPGKPVEELERELGIRDAIKLASNENPRGPGPAVRRAIEAGCAELSRYPDGSGHHLRHALAAGLGVDPTQITLGNGSNDVLDLLARVFIGPGDEGVVDQHGFVVYPLAIDAAGGRTVAVPSRDHGHDLDAMRAAIGPATRMLFIANPNNPTGTVHGRAALEAFLDAVPADVLVVLDEAYFEYGSGADRMDGVAALAQHPNLVVTRTFSKIHGLAAVRLGYAVSSPEIADLLNRVRQPFNVSSLALAAGVAALEDTAFVEDSRRLNAEGMAQLEAGLRARGLTWIPSAANFLTVEVGDAAAVYDGLLRRGVIVRPVAGYGLPRHLRISIGLPEENARLLAALDEIRSTS